MITLFRGKSKFTRHDWMYGDLARRGNKIFITPVGIGKLDLQSFEVIPETVGQLRHENKRDRYFDDDVYYHAGHGDEVVSAFCELHVAVVTGNADDIGEIKGNIHDNPSLL